MIEEESERSHQESAREKPVKKSNSIKASQVSEKTKKSVKKSLAALSHHSSFKMNESFHQNRAPSKKRTSRMEQMSKFSSFKYSKQNSQKSKKSALPKPHKQKA